MNDGIARFKDFTGDSEPIRFQIGSEVFHAFDDIPLKHVGKLAAMAEGLTAGGDDLAEKMVAVFEHLLEPESFQRFSAATAGESSTVIGLGRIQQIVPWLLEQYGLRPTEASSGSGDTSSESGANSTDGAQLAESTSEPSLQSVG